MKPTHLLHVLSIDGRYHQLLVIIHVETGLDPNSKLVQERETIGVGC
jgi:hypothetical protein